MRIHDFWQFGTKQFLGTYAVMNLVIHSFMYTYYMCSALHIRWPDWARQMITLGQLSQMVYLSFHLLKLRDVRYNYLSANCQLGFWNCFCYHPID